MEARTSSRHQRRNIGPSAHAGWESPQTELDSQETQPGSPDRPWSSEAHGLGDETCRDKELGDGLTDAELVEICKNFEAKASSPRPPDSEPLERSTEGEAQASAGQPFSPPRAVPMSQPFEATQAYFDESPPAVSSSAFALRPEARLSPTSPRGGMLSQPFEATQAYFDEASLPPAAAASSSSSSPSAWLPPLGAAVRREVERAEEPTHAFEATQAYFDEPSSCLAAAVSAGRVAEATEATQAYLDEPPPIVGLAATQRVAEAAEATQAYADDVGVTDALNCQAMQQSQPLSTGACFFPATQAYPDEVCIAGPAMTDTLQYEDDDCQVRANEFDLESGRGDREVHKCCENEFDLESGRGNREVHKASDVGDVHFAEVTPRSHEQPSVDILVAEYPATQAYADEIPVVRNPRRFLSLSPSAALSLDMPPPPVPSSASRKKKEHRKLEKGNTQPRSSVANASSKAVLRAEPPRPAAASVPPDQLGGSMPPAEQEQCPDSSSSRVVATPVRTSAASDKKRICMQQPCQEVSPRVGRRRLHGKQPPPMPNPWAKAVSEQLETTAAARKQSAARRSATAEEDVVMAVPASLDVQEQQPKRPCRRSSRSILCFTATGIVLSKRQKQQLESILGAKVVDDWSPQVTHVVANSFKRTMKLMYAVCSGAHVVIPAFIDACLQAGCFVDEEAFCLRDEEGEAAFAIKQGLDSFSLQESLARARSRPLLKGLSVHWAGGTAAAKKELAVLVEAAGGQWLTRAPRVSKASETAAPASSSTTILLGKAFDAELLREASCTQVLRYDAFRL